MLPTPYLQWRILACAMLLVALSSWADLAAQPGKSAYAKVTAIGKEGATIVTDDGKKKQRYVLLELDGKTKIKVFTNQDVTALPNQLIEEHRKLSQDFTERVKKLIQANDFDKLKEAEKSFKAASDEMLSYLGYYAVEGKLTQVGDDLHIDGQLRLVAHRGGDKALKKGQMLVEGIATQVKSKDSSLQAIGNGTQPIVVTGKLAETQLQKEITLRVYGTPRPGEKGGNPQIFADRIEAVKR